MNRIFFIAKNHVQKSNYAPLTIVRFVYVVSPDHSRFCVHLIINNILIINISINIDINDLTVALERLFNFYFRMNKSTHSKCLSIRGLSN